MGKPKTSRSLARFLLLAFAVLGACSTWATEGEPIHASGDKEIWNRAINRVELIGHASVHQVGELLSADYIILDQALRTIDAHGGCIYIANDTVIFGEEMHFNLDTRTGTVVAGRVSNDKFTLSGERINKLGPGRFQTHWGEYSTCRDCGQSWTVSARDMDMEVEGYAYMRDVDIKVKDASTLWVPYLILPMKTHRQSGFLFPEYALNSSNGFEFVEPFFWAINRSADMTIGLGRYASRGDRAEWEGRYSLSPRSQGKANFYYLHDTFFTSGLGEFPGGPARADNRWALEGGATQELAPHLEAKIKLAEVSDNLYPFYFNDIVERNEAYLTSSLNVNYASSDVSANASISRSRDLLNLNTDPTQFDSSTVQAFPSLSATTRDRALFGSPIIGGLSAGATNFTRAAGPFDLDSIQTYYGAGTPAPADYYPGINPIVGSPGFGQADPIRKATRFSLNPSLYTIISPVDGVSLIPSIQYYEYYYAFHHASASNIEVGDLKRGYALVQLDLVTQFEKIYDTEDPRTPKRKHLIRPLLTYSYIPYVQDDPNHPFVQQLAYANQHNLLGYNFDDHDIIPLTTVQSQATYFTPLGNSLTYGFKTQIIDRRETLMKDGKANPNVPPTYRIPFELSAGETFNIYEYRAPVIQGQPQPFTRLFMNMITNHEDKIVTNTTYYYDPTLSGVRSALITSANWIFERAMHQRILAFDRSFVFSYDWDQRGYTSTGYHAIGVGTDSLSMGLNYSLSDYILPSFTFGYDFINHHNTGFTINLAFQSPSQCWKITTGLSVDPTLGHTINFPAISLNLIGNGFEGVSDIGASSAIMSQNPQ
jgi:lipopolysaccharide assembly outer membrane protein LptD (OstA)